MSNSHLNGFYDQGNGGVTIERDCVVQHEGQQFEAGGAMVTPERIIAYLGQNGDLHDWHGRQIGTYRITASWPIRSNISDTMHQIVAVVNGVSYTGRSGGVGLVYRGRRKRR